jgi:metal-dependent amidase/aminoacylase/carboxypeptidase family protein
MTPSVRFPEPRVRDSLPAIIQLRRQLHAIPELGLDLPETASLVEAELRKLGLAPRRAGCGMWVDIGDRGPLVAIRADMDALPVMEMTGLAHASRFPGRMHACGHDAHTACLVGAAGLLVEEAARGRLPFRARLLFQAGEEGHFGARQLIGAGALEGVAAIVGGHVGAVSGELELGPVQGHLHRFGRPRLRAAPHPGPHLRPGRVHPRPQQLPRPGTGPDPARSGLGLLRARR